MNSRPAVKVIFPFITGIIVGNIVQTGVLYCLFLSVLLIIISLIIFKSKKIERDGVWYLMLISSLGLLSIRVQTAAIEKVNQSYNEYFNKKVAITGWIFDRKDYYSETTDFLVEPIVIKSGKEIIRIKGKILIRRKEEKSSFEYGDVIKAEGVLIAPRGVRNPGGFDYKKYLNRHGVYAILKQKSNDLFIISGGREGNFLKRNVIKPLKLRLVKRIEERFSREEAEIVKGVMIGEREGVNPEIKEAFIKSGVIHILAVSGLHVGFVVIFFIFTGKILGIKKNALLIILVPGLIFYILITGARTPVIRASLMIFIIYLGYVIQRKSDIYNSLSVAALIILIIKPYELFNPGFLLSFTAVTAIAFWGPLIYHYFSFKELSKFGILTRIFRRIVFGVVISAGIILFTLPFNSYFFSRISIISIVLNLIFIPLFGFVVFLTALSLILSVIPYIPEYIFEVSAEFILNRLVALSHFASKLPYSSFIISGKTGFFISAIVVTFILFHLLKTIRIKKRLLLLALIMANLFIWGNLYFSGDGKLKVIFFDVGQGDACLIDFPGEDRILIDTGTRIEDYNAFEFQILPYFKREGIKKIDKLIISHHHIDHAGGCMTLLNNCRVDELIEAQWQSNSEYDQLYKLCNNKSVPVKQVKSGDKIVIGRNKYLYILNPMFLSSKLNEDENSLVILLVYGRNKILFTGDIGQTSESGLRLWGSFLDSDIIKVPHHGSKNSSTADFVKMVSPKFAVISVGAFNPYNHPSPEVIERYQSLQALVFRTDKDGAVVFKSDGETLERIRLH